MEYPLQQPSETIPPPVEPSVNPFPEHRAVNFADTTSNGSISSSRAFTSPQGSFTTTIAGRGLPPGYSDLVKERGELALSLTDDSLHAQLQQQSEVGTSIKD